MFEYIYDRMRAAFHYFGVPQTKKGPVFTDISSSKLEHKLHKDLSKLHEGAESTNKPVVGRGISRSQEKCVSRPQEKCISQSQEKSESDQQDGDVVIEELEYGDTEGQKPPSSGQKEFSSVEHNQSEIKPVIDSQDVEGNGSLSEKEKTEKFVEELVRDLIKSSLAEIQMMVGATKDLTDSKNLVDKSSQNDMHSHTLVKDMALKKKDEQSVKDNEDVKNTEEEEDESSESVEDCGEDEEDESKGDISSGTEKEDEEDLESSVYDEELVSQLKEEDLVFMFDEATLCDGKVSV